MTTIRPGCRPSGHALPDHPLACCVLHVAGGRAAGPTDVHGTWTAEIHTGKVYLQVRTAPPPDWTRSGELERRLEHGPELAGRGARRAAANNDQFTMAVA